MIYRYTKIDLSIWVLDKGELTAMDIHEELLAREGRYAELFILQAAEYQ